MRLPPLLTAAAAACLLLAGTAQGVLFSSRRGRNLQLRGTSYSQVTGVTQLQCQAACVGRGNCRSFNYNAARGECQVFSVSVCDHPHYYTGLAAGWTWFDAVADLRTESAQVMWHLSLCVHRGYCRDSCARHLGQYCRHGEQCGLHVTGSVTCRSYRCQCADSHWQFNNTLCLRRNDQLLTDGRHWVWKALVGGLCSTEFDVRAADTVQLLLSEGYSPPANHYELTIGETGSGARVELRRNGISIDTRPADDGTKAGNDTKAGNCTVTGNVKATGSDTEADDASASGNSTGAGDGCVAVTTTTVLPPLLSDSEFIRLKVHWCNGQLRVSPLGGGQDLTWDDPARLTPTHLAFRTPAGGMGLWRFPDRLVDPWFGADWSPTRAYTVPGDTAMVRRRKPSQTDFWVEFACRSGAGCGWEARKRDVWSDGVVFRVSLGVNNTESTILLHRGGSGWSTLAASDAPDITDAGQFRRFRVHFASDGVSVYRQDETAPFLSVSGRNNPISIGFHGPYSPGSGSGGGGEYRLVQYDAGWGAEAGFDWGLGLDSD